METKDTMDYCTFDTLFSKNVPHLLEKIFLSLDYKSYKRCLEVSKLWNDLLTSKSFQRKGKSRGVQMALKSGGILVPIFNKKNLLTKF